MLAVWVAALWIPAARSYAAQAAPSAPGPSSVERLNRVASGLFSGTTPPDQAIHDLKSVLAADPQLAEGHFLLGVAYRMQGSPELTAEARAELVQALALKPELVPARIYLAQLYLDIGRAGPAKETLTEGLAQRTGDPQLLAVSPKPNASSVIRIVRSSLRARYCSTTSRLPRPATILRWRCSTFGSAMRRSPNSSAWFVRGQSS